jgi:hypothetical protein
MPADHIDVWFVSLGASRTNKEASNGHQGRGTGT